jgi:hypothetical protein
MSALTFHRAAFVLGCLSLLLAGCEGGLGTSGIGGGGVLPFDNIVKVNLSGQTAEEAAYLGVAADGEFRITDVKADVVVIEIFDMYCMNCQKDASEVNRLFDLLQKSPLRSRVRFLGIGKKNTVTEAGIYRKRYEVKFPLLPDPEMKNVKAIGEEKTPTFIVVDLISRKVTHKRWRVGSAEELLEEIDKAVRSAAASCPT